MAGCSSDEDSPAPLVAGAAGQAGTGPSAGQSGAAGQGTSGKGGASGSSGQGGQASGSGGAGASGESGQGGSPSGGKAGQGGASQGGGGQGGAGQGGAPAGGQAGQGGAGASGQGGAGEAGQAGAPAGGQAGGGAGGAAAGASGESGAAGQGGQGGSGGAGGQAGASGAGAGGAGAGGSGGQAGSSGSSGQAGAGGGPVGTRVRIVAANLTSGNFQSYDPGHGLRIIEGAQPDIVLIQEFNYKKNTASDFDAFTAQVLGDTGYYFREPGVQIPNGVVSRYPIVASGIWDDPDASNREFAWARIDVPGDRDLWAVSVHLLTKSAPVRDGEAKALVAKIAQQVPPADLLVMGGDFNTDAREEPCIATLTASTFVLNAKFPADQAGNDSTNAGRTKPYDWVLADADLNALEIPVVLGASVFPTGLVIDTRVYTPLAEISPAQMGDSGAPSMQHMGVVRDFALP